MEARDLGQVNERLEQHVQGRDSAGEYRERLGGLQKRYGTLDNSIECCKGAEAFDPIGPRPKLMGSG